MGTSAPSEGPQPGNPYDPPWLDDEGDVGAPDPPEQSEPESDDREKDDGSKKGQESTEIAPPARFLGARNWIGKFAREGRERASFNKAAGHYSTGMGGAGKLSGRMRYATASGARLAEFLLSTGSQPDPATRAWVREIIDQGLSGRSLVDAIIQQVAPSGGSRDEESCVNSMADALGEFLEKNEDADLLDLGEEEIREITELFIANDACSRMVNDVGQVIESERITLVESINLINEMRDYLRADVSVQIEKLWAQNESPSQSQLNDILQTAIERTFSVYESEL